MLSLFEVPVSEPDCSVNVTVTVGAVRSIVTVALSVCALPLPAVSVTPPLAGGGGTGPAGEGGGGVGGGVSGGGPARGKQPGAGAGVGEVRPVGALGVSLGLGEG